MYAISHNTIYFIGTIQRTLIENILNIQFNNVENLIINDIIII